MKQMEIPDWAWAVAGIVLVGVLIGVAQTEGVDTLSTVFSQLRSEITGTSF